MSIKTRVYQGIYFIGTYVDRDSFFLLNVIIYDISNTYLLYTGTVDVKSPVLDVQFWVTFINYLQNKHGNKYNWSLNGFSGTGFFLSTVPIL